jgi:predicted HAD superfamily Cof-like phosphohydrolase
MERSNHGDVGVFHERFGLDNTTGHPPGPREVTKEWLAFRVKFIREELEEFECAAITDDHAAMFDALLDISYVVFGTAHGLGYPWQDGWDAVQAANMLKQRATSPEQSVRGGTFDIIKPPGWTPPDIAGILKRHGWRYV